MKASLRSANWTHTSEAVKFGEWSEHERGLSVSNVTTIIYKWHEMCLENMTYITSIPHVAYLHSADLLWLW